MSEVALAYPGNPPRFNEEELKRLLIWAAHNKVSDVVFKTGHPVMVKQHGRRIRATTRLLTTDEVGNIVNLIYGNNGTAMIAGGRDIDTSYTVVEDRFTRHGYRFNTTGILVDGNNAFSVTLRSIPSIPPSLDSIDFPMHLLEPMSRGFGMVIVTGETGSGKSTLQAALLRHRVEQPDANLNVLTYEAPIEFRFDDVEMPTSMVQQSEIPRSLASFEYAVRNAMRRDPDIILIGESRDAMTMAASIEASRSGHLLMTTMHTNGVPSTVRRAVGMFPEGERNGRAIDIIESTQIMLTQRLLKTLDGQRRAVREYLVFDDHVRDVLLSTPIENLPAVTRDLTKEFGQTMADDARRLYKEGLITEKELRLVAAHEKQRDLDSEAALVGMQSQHLNSNFFEELGQV